MTISVQNVIDRLGDILQDSDHTRWTEAELLRWINDAVKKIITYRPSAGKSKETLTLVAGAKQTITDIQVLDIVRNTSGAAISRTSRELLDAADPSWMTGTESATIQHYAIDERNPQEFFVYPPAIVSTQVEALVVQHPTDVTASTDSISISPEYINVIVDYCGYRCHSKDEETSSTNMAAILLQSFNTALGIKNQAEKSVTPKAHKS